MGMLALSSAVPYVLWARARVYKACVAIPVRRALWRRPDWWLRNGRKQAPVRQAERMSDGFQFLDIILFAAVAAFFVYRLRGVLGKRMGHDKPPSDPFGKRKAESDDDKVISLPDRNKADADEEAPELAEQAEAPGTPLEAGLMQIKLADKSFAEDQFLAGARAAFEMIIATFAGGDAKALRPLLSNDVYADFSGAIAERRAAGHVLETTLVGINEAEIVEAELQARTAFITVKFVSEQINVVRDKKGEVVDGDATDVTKITDVWTFARNLRSRDPNWTLVATRSPS
jgi:predicted lipid-binding transport protein (Tim44 family)